MTEDMFRLALTRLCEKYARVLVVEGAIDDWIALQVEHVKASDGEFNYKRAAEAYRALYQRALVRH